MRKKYNLLSVLITLFVLTSFSSLAKADLSYEVRGVKRESGMFGDAICVSLYIINDSKRSYSFNLFSTSATGDGLTASPSVFSDKRPAFNPNQTLGAKSKARGWLCFDEPEYGWVPEKIIFSEVWGSDFLTVVVNKDK